MYFVRNYELLTRVLWDIYQTRIVDCNRKSSPEKLRRTPDVVVHARLCGFWCSCQYLNLARIKGMRRICETEFATILRKKQRSSRTGVKLWITSLNSHFAGIYFGTIYMALSTWRKENPHRGRIIDEGIRKGLGGFILCQ